MERREFIIGGVAVATLGATSIFCGHATGEELDFSEAPPVVWPAGEPVPTLEKYIQMLDSLTGPANPYPDEVKWARQLLQDIDTSWTPYQIALRFAQWREGKVGRTAEEKKRYSYYAREWPVRGNPVIITFFDATGLRTPVGDTTYWCAAFVSWCIERSLGGPRVKDRVWPYENGAASAAYRDWGKDVERDLGETAQQGDLAVFQNKKDTWRGHIGFVHKVSGDKIWVLGGNQGAKNEYNGGEVNIKDFDRSSGSLKLHSFRRHDALA
jgi:CHAP domain